MIFVLTFRIQRLERNNWLALTDPNDVARVESRTFICSSSQIETIPTPKHGFKSPTPDINLNNLKCSQLGNSNILISVKLIQLIDK